MAKNDRRCTVIKKLKWEQENNGAYGSADFIASYFYITESVVAGKWNWYWYSFMGEACIRSGLCDSIEECKNECQRLAESVIMDYVIDWRS